MPRTALYAAGSFLLGAGAIIGLLVWNPLTPATRMTAAIVTEGGDGSVLERFVIEAPTDIVAVTHNGSNLINPAPVGIAMFDEPELQAGLALVAKLRNADGALVGFAVESEVIDKSSNLMIGRLRMTSDWTVILPGRGTLFLSQIEDGGSVGAEIIPTVMLGNVWSGAKEFVSTVGPDASGRGIVVGGTQEFAGATGTFIELTHLREMSQANGGVGTFELQVSYRLP